MKFEDIKNILRAAFNIKPFEIGCDDCEKDLDKYATYIIKEKDLNDSLTHVKNHLELCSSCNEEYQSLMLAFESV